MKNMKDMKNKIHLNTSSKYKHNKFQIKYLKAKKNNIVLFAKYLADWDEEDNIFYREYFFFTYFDRKKRNVYYIEDWNSAYSGYGFNSRNDMNAFMASFSRGAKRFLDNVLD